MSWQYVGVAALVWVASFVVSLAAITVFLVNLPPGYFLAGPERQALAQQHPVIRWTFRILKNALGFLLVVLGGLLSVPGVPGQGFLTALVGLMLLDFPGKRRWERRIVSQPRVGAAINRLRARWGRPPLVLID
ncbi:MAG: hypothetical protein MUF48_02360 [Pirellulaceae bacterium]|nr:hypothetical protein [Pirellulaceae bacterium]